jgi:hypothetical protein
MQAADSRKGWSDVGRTSCSGNPPGAAGRSIDVGSSAVVLLYGIGTALLGFWVAARYPALGPQRVLPAVVVAAAAFVLQTPLLGLVRAVAASVNPAGALLLVVLPSLTLLFWATGCLIRSLITLAAPYGR